jgi:hypothetical protein
MSYDYEKLKISIPPVYNDADNIYLALDENSKTWSGSSFKVKPEFYVWLKEFDVDKKIIIYRDNFFKASLSSLKNDTRERFMLSQKMGIGNWLVQVDADEIFINFSNFVKTLRKHDRYLDNPSKNPIQISGFLINIYKHLDKGILYVNQPTKVLLATNFPNYKVARKTKERIIYTDNVLLHECLSRTEDELRFKFKNWGHNDELNSTFFDKWRLANETNYKSIKNIFYLEPHKWKELGYFNSKSLDDITNLIKQDDKLNPSRWFLYRKNLGQWIKFLSLLKYKKENKFESYFYD